MLEDIRKSINSVLYERLTSPFFGTLIFSWLVWNWEVWTILFFVNEEKLQTTKVLYIINNYNNIWHILWYPIISTVILLTVIPFVTNAFYWLNLKFQQWRYDQRNLVEKKKLLTLEQSIQIREEIQSQQERFNKVVQTKNSEIADLNRIIEALRNEREITKLENLPNNLSKNDYLNNEEIIMEFHNISNDLKKSKDLALVDRKIVGGYQMFGGDNNPRSEFVSYLESNDYIENSGASIYKYTQKGKALQKLYSEASINK